MGRSRTKMKGVSFFIFAALSALIRHRYFFGLVSQQHTILYQKDDETERLAVRSSKFTPTSNEGASPSSSISWSLPDTPFTPHISALVKFYQNCQPAEGRRLVTVTVDSPNSVPVFLQKGKSGPYFPDVFTKSFHLGSERILPTGKLTIAFSMSDYGGGNETCQFASSAPRGHHCVFNFQDTGRWFRNQTYPLPLPWNERESIPVFRGRFWGWGEFQKLSGLRNLERVKDQFEHNLLESLLHPENITGGRKELISMGGRHKRINLVHFSKLHPELVNARLSPSNATRRQAIADMWNQNATNGLFRVLPYDEIPETEYYTKYQTHIVMGGAGAAFRTARIMKQGIAVILQDYPYQEWFTPLMKPFVHYIPLEQNLSNLNETLQWARESPSKVFDIAMNGKLFYDEYLSHDRMGEFYYELLFRLMLCCGGGDNDENSND